jgi:hypothetical protein
VGVDSSQPGRGRPCLVGLPAPSSTGSVMSSVSATARAKRTSLEGWRWSSTPCVLWNTRYIQRVLAQLEQLGLDIGPQDIERVWPLGFQHVNMLGRYSLELPEPLIHGELRSLRDSSEPAEEDILVG